MKNQTLSRRSSQTRQGARAGAPSGCCPAWAAPRGLALLVSRTGAARGWETCPSAGLGGGKAGQSHLISQLYSCAEMTTTFIFLYI